MKQEDAGVGGFSSHFCVLFNTRTPAMSISTFLKRHCAIFCSYCFLQILKFYPVEQISVQFIFRSIIAIALRSKF